MFTLSVIYIYTGIFRGLEIVFREAIKSLLRLTFSLLLSVFPVSVVMDVSCSFLSLTLSPNIFSLVSPPSACTRAPVLHLRKLSNQVDVTLESSKIVKLALTWVATTQSETIT
jgi:hypothetical protein